MSWNYRIIKDGDKYADAATVKAELARIKEERELIHKKIPFLTRLLNLLKVH